MALGKGKIYYLAHPLTSFGSIKGNQRTEEKIYHDLAKANPDIAFIRPLKIIPEHLTADEAMVICEKLLKACDGLLLSPGWVSSQGCIDETKIALEHKIPTYGIARESTKGRYYIL
jgi:hypothetical protein